MMRWHKTVTLPVLLAAFIAAAAAAAAAAAPDPIPSSSHEWSDANTLSWVQNTCKVRVREPSSAPCSIQELTHGSCNYTEFGVIGDRDQAELDACVEALTLTATKSPKYIAYTTQPMA